MRPDWSISALTPAEATSSMHETKLDALDFVLSVLREHEETLDTLIERLDILMEAFSKIQHRLKVICEKVEQMA